jgi:uncharacterized cupin superfamily protein
MREARLVDTPEGKRIEGEGWFVVNAAELAWATIPDGGTWCMFQPEDGPPQQFGIGIHVLGPGEKPGYYHWESDQEGFLVLSGACLAIVEGEERRLRRWDYLHCPPGTAHITIGTGEEPCAILMVGARTPGHMIRYLPEPLAAAHGAAIAEASSSAQEAYAQWPGPREVSRVPAPWPAAP